MFETLDEYSVDPIMPAASRFKADPRSDRLDLTIRAYQDETGNAPILKAVKETEQILLLGQPTKAYMLFASDPEVCTLCSHTPDHGTEVAKLHFSKPQLRQSWLESLCKMRCRVTGLRDQVVALETELVDQPILSYLAHQVGMFSLFPFSEEQETEFRQQSSIYLVSGAKVYIARVGKASMRLVIAEVHSNLITSRLEHCNGHARH